MFKFVTRLRVTFGVTTDDPVTNPVKITVSGSDKTPRDSTPKGRDRQWNRLGWKVSTEEDLEGGEDPVSVSEKSFSSRGPLRFRSFFPFVLLVRSVLS